MFLDGTFQRTMNFKIKSAYEEDENGVTYDLLAPFNWSTLELPFKKIKVGLGNN
jgi:hypothetical protein